TYVLKAGNTLQLTTVISNLDDKLIPVADGWHHYFTLGDSINECQLEFQSKQMLLSDDELIPTGKQVAYLEYGALKMLGETRLNDCYVLDFTECQPLCVLRNPKNKIE